MKNQILFYISLVLTALAKALPHSILTVLLLAKGLTMSDIIWIQSMYSFAMLLFEIPSGVWADLYSRKLLYLLSNFLLIIFFMMVLYCHDWPLLMLAWFVYGICQALNSGTLEAQIINDLKIASSQHAVNQFIKHTQQLSLMSMIIGSVIGAYLYFKIESQIYLLAAGLTMLAIVNIMFFRNQHQKITQNVTIMSHIKASLLEFKHTPALKFIFMLSLISQIFFQTHYQLWQALFIAKHMDATYFPILYIIFQFISIIALSLAKSLLAQLKYLSKIILLLSLILPFILLKNMYIVMLIYMIYVMSFTMINYFIDTQFSQQVSLQNISALTSMRSSVSRLVAVVVLLLSGILVKYIRIDMVIALNFFIALMSMVMVYRKEY